MGNNENKATYEISLKEIFQIFKRGLWLMLACAIVFGALAFGYSSLFIPKTYTSTVKLYVKTAYSNDGGYSALSNFNLASKKVNTYIQILDSNKFREKLSDNLDNKYTTVQLSRMISFKKSDDEDTEVFSASVRGSSPTEAKVIADSLSEVAPGIMSGVDEDTELKIVDNATIPTKPSSPNVLKNTFIAVAAGFLLALVYTFVREALDNKVKYNNDMTEIENIPILSAIPDFGEDRVLIGNTTANSENKEESEG